MNEWQCQQHSAHVETHSNCNGISQLDKEILVTSSGKCLKCCVYCKYHLFELSCSLHFAYAVCLEVSIWIFVLCIRGLVYFPVVQKKDIYILLINLRFKMVDRDLFMLEYIIG
jgi:hypothetical protein